MTTANTSIVAKASVAFVAVAMLLSMVAPAKAATIEELQAMIAQLTAQLSSLSGSTTTTTAATFTRSLTVGAQGADVTALQNFLIAKGHTIAAGATGYFGAQTASAVAAWQAANGVTPATGYFGPVSQAKYASMVSTTVNTTPSTLNGGAGSASVTSYSSDVEDEVTTGTSEKVLGFKVEADDSDVKVTNVKLSFAKESDTASTIITRYFDSFDVVMGGNVVATVDASDLNRDSSGNYSKNVALKDAIVKEGSANKAIFYVVAHANDAIDTADAAADWTITASDLRYTDGSGAILTIGTVNNNADVEVTKLSTSGDVKVKYSLATDSPKAGTVKVDDDNSGDKVELLKFRVKAEGTDVSFDKVVFTVVATGSTSAQMVSEYILMKGSDTVETEDAITGTSTLTFDLDDEEMIDEDDTETYTLVAKMNKNVFVGSSLTASLASTNVMDSNGDTVATSRISGSAAGDAQTFRGDGVTLAKTSITATDITKTVGSTDSEYAKFVVTFTVTADGDDVYVADVASAIAASTTLNGTASTTANIGTALTSTADKDGSSYRINDGETETFTYTVETNTAVATAKLIVNSLTFGASAATPTGSSQAFTPVSTWTSDAVILN